MSSRAILATRGGADILARVLDPERPSFTSAAAQSILTLDFTEADRQRMDELAEKARAGALLPEEEQLLENYLFVGSMLDLMHSKARLSLHRSNRTA